MLKLTNIDAKIHQRTIFHAKVQQLLIKDAKYCQRSWQISTTANCAQIKEYMTIFG